MEATANAAVASVHHKSPVCWNMANDTAARRNQRGAKKSFTA